MKPTIIKTSTRYVSEIEQFSEGLPHGILNKTKADVGGSYLAINCPTNYIVVCPFKDLCDSLEADKNNKYNVFKIYGGVEKEDFDLYSKKNKIKKIVVTFDSFDKLTTWINPKDYKLLIETAKSYEEDSTLITAMSQNVRDVSKSINEVINHNFFL